MNEGLQQRGQHVSLVGTTLRGVKIDDGLRQGVWTPNEFPTVGGQPISLVGTTPSSIVLGSRGTYFRYA